MADSNIIITSSVESLRRQNPNALRPEESSGGDVVSAGMDLSPLLEVSEQTLSEIREINSNFEEFFDKMELQRLRSRDTDAPSPVQTTTEAPSKQKEEDDAGFLFDGIVLAFAAFKTRILDFAKRFKNFIKIIAKPFVIITAAVSGVLGFIEGFTADENKTLGQKVIGGIGTGIEKILDTIVAWPAQMLVEAGAWLARALGAESVAEYLDKVDIRKALSDLFNSRISELIKEFFVSAFDPIFSFFDNRDDSAAQERAAQEREKLVAGIAKFRDSIFGGVKFLSELVENIANFPRILANKIIDKAKEYGVAWALPDAITNMASGGENMVSTPGETTRETSSASLSEESRTAAAQNIMGQQSSVNVIDNSVSSTSNSSSSAAIMMEVPGATDRHDQYRGRNGYAFAS